MSETFEFKMTFKCENCGEKYEIKEWSCSEYEYDSETIECNCGATIELDWSVDFDLNVHCKVPKPDGEVEVVAPGPNQIDMFTGLTIEQARFKALGL